MKTKLFITAAIAILAVACAKEQPALEQESTSGLKIIASVEQPSGDTKTSLDGLNVKWTKGDQIYLTDGTNWAIYEADATAASTTFTKVPDVGSGTLADGSIYAYYPADKVDSFDNSNKAFTTTIPAVQVFKAGGFADGVNPLTAKGTLAAGSLSLSFRNVFAFVKLQVSDCSSSKILTGLSLTSSTANLCGTATVTVDTEGYATTTIAGSTKKVEVSGISVNTPAAASVYIAVPAGNLGNLTITAITAETTGLFTHPNTAGHSLTTERKNIYSFNPISISAFLGSETKVAEPVANCYMVNGSSESTINIPLYQAIAGWDAIKALEPDDTFDKSKIVSGTRTIIVRWLDGTGSITMSSIDEAVLSLNLAPTTNGSNAVVDLKNGSEIIWSWHIWFTDYKPTSSSAENGQVHAYNGEAFQEGGLYNGHVMMDRNLGATKTGVVGAISLPDSNSEAEKYWGLFYQFGRKDPFATSGYLANGDQRDVTEPAAKGTYADAVQNPNIFYYTKTSADAWSSTDAAKSDDNMTDPWNANGNKSAFDPCPAGWRIPKNSADNTMNVWSDFSSSVWTGSSLTSGRYYDNRVWTPASGYRDPKNSGAIGNRGVSMYYWAASPRIAGAGIFAYFDQSGVWQTITGATSGSRAMGLSVRCVSE